MPECRQTSSPGRQISHTRFVAKGSTHNDRVVSLHALLDADFYREGARVTPAPRRRQQRRTRRKHTAAPWLVPVTPDVARRLSVIQREWQRIDPLLLDEDEQRFWATIDTSQLGCTDAVDGRMGPRARRHVAGRVAGVATGRRLAPLPPGTFALVESALPGLPAGVPSGAQSVPLLILEGDAVIPLGMAERDVRARRFTPFSAGPALTAPGVLGERAIMPFRSGPSRFWVVLDRTDAGREREVTAIYVR